jgi:hypothetical protein
VAQGTYSARFDLPSSPLRTACETLRHRTVGGDGADQYYALEEMFPTNWQEPSSWFWGMGIAQFNYTALTGPPVGLSAHGDHVNVTMQTGAVTNGVSQYSTGNDDSSGNIPCSPSCRIIPAGQLTRGVWHQMIIHVHWATGSSGLVETFWRRKGESTWNPQMRMSGFPTLQWPAATGPYPSTHDTSDKIGAYRGAASFPISVWSDGFCTATTFAAAASCL